MSKLRGIINNIADYILRLPAGTEISLKEVFDELYLKDGYTWMYKDTNAGWVCTKDECESFLIMDSDLFDVLNGVRKVVKQHEVQLDLSKWDDMCVGLPYNLDFVIRKSEQVLEQ